MSKIITIKLPDIGEGVAEGEVIEWRKKVNDAVSQDEPIVVVMTDKATVELPSPYPGRLIKQYHSPGQVALVGKPLYDLEIEDTISLPQEKKEFQKEIAPTPLSKEEERSKITQNAAQVLATPKVRGLAKELGIDLSSLKGTGKDGRITEQDLRQNKETIQLSSSGKRASPEIHSSTPLLHFEDDEEKPLIGIRHLTAEKMVESKYIIPHYSYFDQLDATRLIQLRNNIKPEAEKQGIKATFMPFFIKGLSLALSKYPQVNGSVDFKENKLIIHKHQNIGIATNTPLGLIVCVLKNVQNMSLQQIIREYDALMLRARAGKLKHEDMQDSTITITNFGTLGGLWATPIINYPEIAILGIAKIRKEAIVKGQEIISCDMVNLSWSFDHRVIDGSQAAEFSNAFIDIMKNPASLL